MFRPKIANNHRAKKLALDLIKISVGIMLYAMIAVPAVWGCNGASVTFLVALFFSCCLFIAGSWLLVKLKIAKEQREVQLFLEKKK